MAVVMISNLVRMVRRRPVSYLRNYSGDLKSKLPAVDFVVLSPERDVEDVHELFINEYLTREPTILGLSGTPSDFTDYYLPEFTEAVESGTSVGARDKESGKLVGACLNTIYTPGKEAIKRPPNNNKLTDNLDAMQAEVDAATESLFEKYNVEKIMFMGIVAIIPGYDGQGLFRKFYEMQGPLGIAKGCQLAFMQASHPATEGFAKKCGFKVYFESDWSKYAKIDLSKTHGMTGYVCLVKRL